MSQLVYQIPFYLGGPIPTVDEDGCWIGLPSPFETRLLEPFPTYALEQLRARFLYILTTTHEGKKSARVCLQMPYETEIGTILVKLMTAPADLYKYKVCERRRYIEIDRDMQLQRYLIPPALDELARIPDMPSPYMDYLIRYLLSDYPRYRMSAIATALCVAKVLTP
jgi:hypothetical protein